MVVLTVPKAVVGLFQKEFRVRCTVFGYGLGPFDGILLEFCK